MTTPLEDWMLDTIRSIVTGNYSIEGLHRWQLHIDSIGKAKLIATEFSTGEQVYETEVAAPPGANTTTILLNHVISAYRSDGQFYAETRLFCSACRIPVMGQWKHRMTIITPL